MSDADLPTPPTAPKWSRMPAGLRLELEAAVDAHLRRYDGQHYELLRDDPRFLAWIGTHLGDRGDKYLDRVIRKVRAAQTRLERLRDARHRPVGRAGPGGPSPVQGDEAALPVLADAGAPSFADLMADLHDQRDALIWEAAALRDATGRIIDFDRWTRVCIELRAVGRAMADLTKHYQAVWAQAETRKAMFQRIGEEFRDEPRRGHALMRDLNALLTEKSGIRGAAEKGRG